MPRPDLSVNLPVNEERTRFDSDGTLGLAVEDLASAHHIYQKAKAEGIGTWVTSMASES